MTNVQEIFKKSSPWMRLSICVNIHVKEALLNVVHNRICEPQVNAIPSDTNALYTFLQNNKNKIQKSPFLKSQQKAILLPTNCQSVDSASLDITLIRYLIQTFCGIKNANKDWKEPATTDKTLCAYVFRAADFRNRICHDNNVDKLDAATFERKWKELKDILQGLKYVEDIEHFKTKTLEFDKLECVILEEFVEHLRSYKEECLNEPFQDDYIQRRFYVNRNRNYFVIKSNIVIESDLENIITNNDFVMIYAEAGMGKSSTAKRIKKEWCNQNILKDFNLLYFDSKKMNKRLRVQSHAAPLYFSELGDFLKKNGRTEDNLSIYSCVKTTIEKLIILIDGVDEFPIRELVTGSYLDELERKVKDNKLITGTETISAIYFGHLFPYSKVILLGRIGEFESLKKVNVKRDAAIFNRRTKDLELLEFEDANIKDFTCLKICEQPSQQSTCTGPCQEIYDRIKNIELCKIPTDLNSLIELYKRHPNKNIGKITRTKLIIASLFNRLTNHIKQKNNLTIKIFREISKQNDFSKYMSCIRTLGEVSCKSLLENNVTISVEEEQDSNGIIYFKYDNQISIEREILEELDLFYIRDLDYYSILEPHHTLNIEFLSACYLFSHPDGWDSILKLNKDRKLVIISFTAGLHADDYFTKDFVKNVLNPSSYSLEKFFSWLYNIEDVRLSLPNGGSGYNCWFGLMENQKLSPSFFLLDFISREVEIPQIFLPQTIVCFCSVDSFEWYDMKYFKHDFLTKLSDEFNIELYLKKFPSFKFIIKGDIRIKNNDEFYRLDQCGANNLITFRINGLHIDSSLNTWFRFYLNVNTLNISWDCDSRTIDLILNAISPPTTNSSLSNIQPAIKFKRLRTYNIEHNSQQIENLSKLCLSAVVNNIVMGYSTSFTDGPLAILENVERNTNKLINIELWKANLNEMFGLPNLGNRNVLLVDINNITNNDVIKLKERISSGYSNNLANHKIIDEYVPFVRKENSSQDCKQSMFLNLCYVDFGQVSPEVFANTCSLIPSLSFSDHDFHGIPSSYWSRLSRIEDCQINEMRIWKPRPKNFQHFVNIKTKMKQFICNGKDDLKQLLDLITSNQGIEFDKEIKIFIVKFDSSNWDYYEEIMLFEEKTIEEYKNNYSSDNLLLNNIRVPFHEGEQHLNWWCCEISVPFHEKTKLCVTNTYHHLSESSIEETKDESPIVKKLKMNCENCGRKFVS